MVWVARVGSGLSVAPLRAPSWGGFRGLLPWCVGVCSMVGGAVSRWVEPFPGGWSHFLVGGAVSRWVEPFLSSAPGARTPSPFPAPPPGEASGSLYRDQHSAIYGDSF